MNILLIGHLLQYGNKFKVFVRRGHKITYLSTFYFCDELWDFKDGTITYEHFNDLDDMRKNLKERVACLVERDKIDVIWVYAVEADHSNEVIPQIRELDLKVPIIRHCEEHYCQFNELEKISLEESDGQMYHNQENRDFLGTMYNLSDNYIIAPTITPSFETYVPAEPLPRLSEDRNHAVIASGYIGAGDVDVYRIDYREVVSKLAEGGIPVDVYGNIMEDVKEDFEALERRYPDLVRIKGFVNMKTSCALTTQYDYGIVYAHAERYWPVLEERITYNRINYPARMYNYIAAGIPMILKRGIYDAMETLFRRHDIALYYDSYDELIEKLKDRELNERLKANVRKCRQFFSMEYHADRIIHFFQKNVEIKRGGGTCRKAA